MSYRFGSPTPASPSESSRRKRRRYLSRSDEEILDEMDKSELSYRTGWPQLPPLPVDESLKGARDSVDNGSAIIEIIQTILETQRVHAFAIYFAYRTPRDMDASEIKETYHTLVVTVDSTTAHSLQPSIIQIRQLLKRHATTEDTSIELIDHRAVSGLFTRAVRYDNAPVLEAWPVVSEIAISTLQENGQSWLSIELLYRGLLEHQCSPTIVITTPSASDIVWRSTILPELRRRLSTLVPSFGIEILCGLTLMTTRSDCPSSVSYDATITMGASIGLVDHATHAGTVGGFIRLSNNETLGLTNHHVARDERIDSVIAKEGKRYLSPGNPELKKTAHLFMSPSEMDHVDYLQDLENRKITWEAQKTKGHTDAPRELQQIQESKDRAMNAPRKFANLHASSGFRLVDRFEYETAPNRKFMLDWALLKPVEHREVRNEMPRKNMTLDGAKTDIVGGQLCDTWTPLNKGKVNLKRYEVDVVKHGRTTNFTFGSINCALTKVNPKADEQWKKTGEAYSFSDTDVGHCYSVIKRGKREFVAAGDSGSIIVHDASGTWLGLLFGESGAGSALMLPMQMVFEDIEQVTGSAVVEPKQENDP